ncbi:MAG: hypothetical protein K8R90_05750, partial [Candidatus Cloacimonetes bacterium]|nr:hypothetical protein [Candidatus Cloacimonadota bacterium]
MNKLSLFVIIALFVSVNLFAFAGGDGSSGNPYQVSNLTELQDVGNYLSSHFIQTADIDASATSGWNGGAGFSPIGIDGMTNFTGTYDGDGHTVDGLYINRSSSDNQGLFGRTNGATIENLGITGVDITGDYCVGGLVGNNVSSTVTNSYSTGSVSGGGYYTGGLAGYNNDTSTITNCYSTGSVSGSSVVGGLVGGNTSSTITYCYSTGSVSGSSVVGGLVGNNSGTVTASFWDTETSGQSASAGGTGKTTAQMKTQSTFTDAGWDFAFESVNGTDDYWYMYEILNSGYPVLSIQSASFPLTVSTTAATSITHESAMSGGEVVFSGGEAVTARGVCWSESADPTLSDPHTVDGAGVGVFTSAITGLTHNVEYHYRAYATNSFGTSYGSDLTFTTDTFPTVTTTVATSITHGSAASGGEVTDDGGDAVTARGVCWSETADPTTSDSHTVDGAGTGVFTSAITGLTPNTEYHYRAYAINSIGTSYGADLTFTTLSGAPYVTTTAATAITTNSASSGGDVISAGEDAVTARGVCWSTSANPTLSDSHTIDGAGTGVFTSAITGLNPGTEYHYRAYATNSIGASYGADLTFTTILVGSGTPADPYQISNLAALRWLSENSSSWGAYFKQTADIDASDTQNWNGGEGFSPIGNTSTSFSGAYDGDGYTIDSLFINRPGSSEQGLFGCTDGATIENLGVTNVDVTGNGSTGGLVGNNNNSPTINNCYSTGSVSGGSSIGGLVGNISNSTITNSYSAGSVSGGDFYTGGLVGNISNSTITNSYSAGSVSGDIYTGGLVGAHHSSSTISNCYSAGSVSGDIYTGGLVGWNNYATINNSYSTGSVSGTILVGGLVGLNSGTVTASFWDTETSGQSTSAGGTGKTTAEMQTQSTFTDAGWDFIGESVNGLDEIWMIMPNEYPYLTCEYSPFITSVDDIPGDQGHQIRLTWTKAGLDTQYSAARFYSVWRLVEDARSIEASAVVIDDLANFAAPSPDNDVELILNQREDFWEFIISVPATMFNQYLLTAPTLVDSSYTLTPEEYQSTFMVMYHFELGYFA